MYVTEREHSLIKRTFVLRTFSHKTNICTTYVHSLICMYMTEREHSLIKGMFILRILHHLVQMQFGNFYTIPHNFQNRGNYTPPILCTISFISLTNLREKFSTMVFKTRHVHYQDYALTEEQHKSKEVSS
jgi:hypothetical protein